MTQKNSENSEPSLPETENGLPSEPLAEAKPKGTTGFRRFTPSDRDIEEIRLQQKPVDPVRQEH